MRKAATLLLLIGTCLGCFLSVTGAAEPQRVLFLFPSVGVMGSEFFAALEIFGERGIQADAAAGETGAYEFWEDSGEGRASGVPGGYAYDVPLAIEDVELDRYDAVLIGPGFAHAFWFGSGHKRGIELIHEAADRGIPLGGTSFGVWVLLGQGLLDGRTACDWPHALGVVSAQAHWDGFLSGFDTTFVDACVHVDEGAEGQSTIVTANHRCPAAFASAIADLLEDTD